MLTQQQLELSHTPDTLAPAPLRMPYQATKTTALREAGLDSEIMLNNFPCSNVTRAVCVEETQRHTVTPCL